LEVVEKQVVAHNHPLASFDREDQEA